MFASPGEHWERHAVGRLDSKIVSRATPRMEVFFCFSNRGGPAFPRVPWRGSPCAKALDMDGIAEASSALLYQNRMHALARASRGIGGQLTESTFIPMVSPYKKRELPGRTRTRDGLRSHLPIGLFPGTVLYRVPVHYTTTLQYCSATGYSTVL